MCFQSFPSNLEGGDWDRLRNTRFFGETLLSRNLRRMSNTGEKYSKINKINHFRMFQIPKRSSNNLNGNLTITSLEKSFEERDLYNGKTEIVKMFYLL